MMLIDTVVNLLLSRPFTRTKEITSAVASEQEHQIETSARSARKKTGKQACKLKNCYNTTTIAVRTICKPL
jgi:hypothetical protein